MRLRTTTIAAALATTVALLGVALPAGAARAHRAGTLDIVATTTQL
jgi:uncharacterized membrane protein YjfL (UPF0719 family)